MRATILIFLVTVLSGCRLLPGGTEVPIDGEWQLQSGTSQGQVVPIVTGSHITLKIEGGQVGGSSACNIYGGTIKANGSEVTISAQSMTEMACQENLMASEAAYLAALPRVTAVERTGSTLVLTGPDVELRFVVIPPVADANLVGTRWVLESLISGDVVSSTVAGATLQLGDDGTIAASTGCRDLTGSFTTSGARVQVTLDPYDLYACTSPLGDQDTHVLGVLSQGFSFAIDGNRLTLTAGDKGLAYRVAAAE
jgi:heat shock protein HslJ